MVPTWNVGNRKVEAYLNSEKRLQSLILQPAAVRLAQSSLFITLLVRYY